MVDIKSGAGQSNRLPGGGRIDRSRLLEFSFNKKRYQGYQGDTLASALLANQVRVVGRSFKYHRPRGIVAGGAEEPNAIMQVESGVGTTPNLRATQVELYYGLSASSVNCWPNVDFDIGAFTGAISRILPAGFYYKTFMWPQSLWMWYEGHIRRAAGLGRVPSGPDPDTYDRYNSHCDVLVAGGGASGLAAALAAARTGARVLIADEQNELGGQLLGNHEPIDAGPGTEWVNEVGAELAALENVRVLTRTTVFGYYSHNFLGLLERCSDHLPPGSGIGPRQRLWRVRAKQVVLATGAIERPLVFANNDRPGVMLASAVSMYVNRYAVTPGSRSVVFTNNDSAYATAFDLADRGETVAGIVDARHEPRNELMTAARERNIQVIPGHVVVDVNGINRVDGIQLMKLDNAGESVEGLPHHLATDLLAVSGGWSPAVHLHSQSGGRTRFDPELACFVPDTGFQKERSAGACNGAFSLGGCLEQGFEAGAKAAHAAGFGNGKPPLAPRTDDRGTAPIRAMWVVPSSLPISRAPKMFVDLQNDTSASDIELAVREGYDSIEHVKRYTALGFGTDQGKLGNINGAAIAARALGEDISVTGTTTFRPAYTPVTFGAIAAGEPGVLYDPIRKSAMHVWHEENGAEFEDVGQWKRPWYYPRPGENMHDAVNRECLATRHGVGILDASTLGKIDIRGPDAAEFLDRVYTNGWKKLAVGRARYGFMLGEDGMVMDDGVTTRVGEQQYHMTTTTGGAAHVMSWLERWLQTEWPELKVYLTSVTDHWATVSLAGPNSRLVCETVCQGVDFDAEAFPFMSVRDGQAAGVPARICRISFSGELAYELNVDANYGRHVWEACMSAGHDLDITPYGTEAMHVLRAEKGFVIVGQDTDGSVTPQDLGMDWICARHKDFLGKRSLIRTDCVRDDRKQLVGLRTENPLEVLPEGAQLTDTPKAPVPVPMIGHVSSSYFSACLGHSIALALVKAGRTRLDETIYAPLADGRVVPARIAAPIFYDTEGERQNV